MDSFHAGILKNWLGRNAAFGQTFDFSGAKTNLLALLKSVELSFMLPQSLGARLCSVWYIWYISKHSIESLHQTNLYYVVFCHMMNNTNTSDHPVCWAVKELLPLISVQKHEI